MPLDASIQHGIRHLRNTDPIMRNVIRKAGPFRLHRRNDRFHALALAIVSQQISGKAARSVWAKLKTIASPLSPERILELPIEELRKAGLSGQKASYLLDLANHVCDGRLQLNRIGRRSDEEVIEALVAVKGIGLWTAQMFLIFSLGRLDVLPHADLDCGRRYRDSTISTNCPTAKPATALQNRGGHMPASRRGIAGAAWIESKGSAKRIRTAVGAVYDRARSIMSRNIELKGCGRS